MKLQSRDIANAPTVGLRPSALGDVDGLKLSQYLISLAKENIEGRITIDEVIKRIDEHMKNRRLGRNMVRRRQKQLQIYTDMMSV